MSELCPTSKPSRLFLNIGKGITQTLSSGVKRRWPGRATLCIPTHLRSSRWLTGSWRRKKRRGPCWPEENHWRLERCQRASLVIPETLGWPGSLRAFSSTKRARSSMFQLRSRRFCRANSTCKLKCVVRSLALQAGRFFQSGLLCSPLRNHGAVLCESFRPLRDLFLLGILFFHLAVPGGILAVSSMSRITN